MEGVGYELAAGQRQALGTSDAPGIRTVQLTVPVPDAITSREIDDRFAQLVASNEILRTVFVRTPGLGQQMQMIKPESTVSVVHLGPDVSLDEMLARPARLDLTDGRGLDVVVGAGHLHITAAAAVADRRSMHLIADALLAPEAPDNADVLQVVDYAAWEAEQLGDGASEARVARGYWTTAATDKGGVHELPLYELVALPVDGVELSGAEWLAAWVAVRARYQMSDDDSGLAIRVDGRVDDDLTTAIGPYERYVPLCDIYDGDATLSALAVRAAAERRAAARFAAAAPAPAVDAAFAEQDPTDPIAGTGAFPLELVVAGPNATLCYAPSAVDDGQAGRLVAQLRTVARAGYSPLRGVDIRGEDERALLSGWLTGSDVSAADSTVVDAIVAHAAATPDTIAVACGDDTVTYAELDRRSAALAARLRADGAPVAILLDRSAPAIVALVAALRVGSPYLVINGEVPAARLVEQLSLSGAGELVVAAGSQAPPGLPAGVRVVELSDGAVTGDDGTGSPPPRMPAPGDLAYLVFTSGSTGTPKPVAVTHANLATYVRSVTALLGIDGTARFAAVTSLSTDLGNTAVFGALTNGATVEVVPEPVALDSARFAELVTDRGISAVKTTPSHLRLLLADTVRLDLPLLVVGGEALDASLVAAARAAGVVRIVNHYGPTETTIGVVAHDVAPDAGDPIPLGNPLAHVRAHVLDRHGMPAPLGAPGELAVAGPAVSPGYLGLPDDTARRFVPELGRPRDVMYMTGDRVQVRGDGSIEFLGRADDQVKVRGYRVELGEIESVLRSLPAVSQAAASVDGDSVRAYVVAERGFDADAAQRDLVRRLPSYLVPARFDVVPRLPMTASGKVDRVALRDVVTTVSEAAAGGTPPRTTTESALLAIWRDVLPHAGFGVEDNFFRVGGHSLLATRVVSRAREQFGVDVPLHVIFAKSTIGEMAADIDERRQAADEPDDELAALLAEVESMSEADVERELAAEDTRGRDDK